MYTSLKFVEVVFLHVQGEFRLHKICTDEKEAKAFILSRLQNHKFTFIIDGVTQTMTLTNKKLSVKFNEVGVDGKRVIITDVVLQGKEPLSQRCNLVVVRWKVG